MSHFYYMEMGMVRVERSDALYWKFEIQTMGYWLAFCL